MKNSEMKKNRFLIRHEAKKIVQAIKDRLSQKGGVVVIQNYMRAVHYTTPKHAALFEARADGAYVREGRRMVRFDVGNAIRFGFMK